MASRFGLNEVLGSECCVPSCGADPAEDAPFPICMRHMRQVFNYFDGFREIAMQVVAARYPVDEAEVVAKVRAAHERMPNTREPDRTNEQVYYARTGEFIKIGVTVNVQQRMSAMRLPLSAVLATEPGDRQLEHARHRQFAHLRDGRRENFRPAEDLLSHVAMIREHYGPPKLTSWNGRVVALDALDADAKGA